ncbi:MAG: hypothetical protein IJW63_11220 [Lachnospiraceae bacterium]|nr:hypothetical protein [Lachnospiraceae bacterium]
MMKKVKKVLVLLTCLAMTLAMMTGCGNGNANQDEVTKVKVTFMRGDVNLGTVETEAGKTLEASSYAAYETAEDATFLGWFGTPTYLEASKQDLATATFSEDTTLYGCFQSTQVTEDTRVWYIVGASSKGALAESAWAGSVDDTVKAKFQLTATGNATNEFSITLDLYAGDQFQVIHDWQWNEQHGFGYLEEYDASQFENGGGLSGSDNGSNVNVVADGNYTITLTTNPDDAAMDKIVIVRNGDAAAAEEIVVEEPKFELKENTGVKVKGSWVADWSELKDLTKVSEGVYEITMDLAAGTELYFSVFEGDADTGFGLKAENVVDDASKALLKEAYNVTVAEDGTYTFTVDLNAYTISVAK